MTGVSRPLGALLLAGAVAGCSDAPRAIQTAKEIEKQANAAKPIALPKEPPPAASDPAAADLVKAALAAHTGGDPSKLDKFKAYRLERKGDFLASAPSQQMTWTFAGRWPEQFRADVQQTVGKFTLCRNGRDIWNAVAALGSTKKPVDSVEVKGVLADTTYEWLSVLVPLTDPALVIAPFPERTVLGKPAVGVRLTGPNLPSAVAHFDKESKLLVQFSYEGVEAGRSVVKEQQVRSYREVAGVKLPEKLAIRWDGVPAVEWELQKLETGVDFPAKYFEEP